MRFALAVAVCGGLVLAGCGGGSSSGSGGTPPILPPTANAGGPYTGSVGTAVTFNGSGSKDPQNQALTYSWSFGDGGTGTGANPTHTYAQVAGQTSTVYTVSLTVQDTSGYSGQAGTTATIQGVAPLPDAGLTGMVATGTTPIVGAHVYLFAASTGSPGTSSVSLLSATETGTSDAVGTYVLTNSMGNFTMSGDYTCTSGQQLYIYALGGTAGTQSVPSAGLLAAIGSCPATSSSVVAQVNEVSTVAAAYALAGFATDAVHVSSSGTALALTGIANAFANAANLVKLSTGVALTTTAAGNGTVPQAEIDSLANILSVCVNPGNFVAINCSQLLQDALSVAGTQPTDTATAAINIAHNPGSSLISDIYNFQPSSPPYTPALGRQPNDFTIAVSYSGGGLNGPQGIAIDGTGNAWIANVSGNSVTKLSSAGAVATGSPYTGSGISGPAAIAIDGGGNAWIANSGNGSVTEYSATGTAMSGTNGFTGCNMSGPKGIAIDGSNNVWIPDAGHNDVCELSNAGVVVSTPGTGFTGGGLNNPDAIAIDGGGNVWVANFAGGGSVSKFSSAGAVLSGANGYTGSGLHDANGVATDKNGSAWITNLSPSSVTEISTSGVLVSGTNGYTSGALSSPVGVAVDGLGNVWVANQSGNTVTEFSNAAAVVSGSTGYGGATGTASGIAIDGSGNVWVGNSTQGSVTVYIGAATPVVTPLAVAVKNNTVGARP
jgi:streptogramin lyase